MNNRLSCRSLLSAGEIWRLRSNATRALGSEVMLNIHIHPFVCTLQYSCCVSPLAASAEMPTRHQHVVRRLWLFDRARASWENGAALG